MKRLDAKARKAENPCDWCEAKAEWRTPIYPDSLIFAYACHEHKQTLAHFENARPKRRRVK